MTKINIGVAGRFRYEVWNKGQIKESSGWMNNMVLDSGLLHLLSGQTTSVRHRCVAGTGNSPPDPTQTALDNQVMSSISQQQDNPPPASLHNSGGEVYTYSQSTYSFPARTSPVNISELGISIGTTEVLFSRVLVKDPLGNPTTISLIEEDELRVTYEIRRYAQMEDYVHEVGEYTITSRPIGVAGRSGDYSFWNPWLPAVTSRRAPSTSAIRFVTTPIQDMFERPSSTGSVATSSTSFYTAVDNGDGTFSKRVMARWGTERVINTGRTMVLAWDSGGSGSVFVMDAFQFEFEPPIVKPNTEVLEIDVVFTVSRVDID